MTLLYLTSVYFSEQGHYMALDLGGTNFRVLKVILEKHNKFEMIKEKYEFPEEMKVGPGEKVSSTYSHIEEKIYPLELFLFLINRCSLNVFNFDS